MQFTENDHKAFNKLLNSAYVLFIMKRFSSNIRFRSEVLHINRS